MLDEIEQQLWNNLLRTIWESWMLSRKSWGSILAHSRVENIRGGEFDAWLWMILEPTEGEEVSEVRFYIIDAWIYSTVFSTVVGAYAGFRYSRFSFLDMVRNEASIAVGECDDNEMQFPLVEEGKDQVPSPECSTSRGS